MIVRAGLLYDGTLERPRQNVDIHVHNGRITELCDAAEGGTYDRDAACVTPGLVNAHVHLEMSGEPDAMAAMTSPSNQRMLRAVANARKSLAAGVTTVRDVGSKDNVSIDLRDAIVAGYVPGPRVRAAGHVLCMTGGHGWFVGRQVDSPWDGRKAVREQLVAGADCIKLIATGGVLTKGAIPGRAQLTSDEVDAIVDEAHRHGLKVASHAIGTEGILNALRAGIDSVEHGHLLDDEAIELFLRNGTYLVPTLTAPTCILEHVHEGKQPAFVTEKAQQISEAMAHNIRRAYEAGVKIAGGSDAGTPYNYHDAYAYELELMHTILGMTPQQSLHAATAVAAELVGLHRGTIAPGEPADLVLLGADAGTDIRAFRDVRAVVKDGEFV